MSAIISGAGLEGDYSEQLYNEDLAPLARVGSAGPVARTQHWTWYNIFAFWMADVHSVGGYVFAASLFALGLTGWEVLVCLLAGICIVQLFANLLGKAGQNAGVPYAVVSRVAFGVYGANIAAIIRGLIAVVWYGIQTYLASGALNIVLLKFFPGIQSLSHSSFAGLDGMGWLSFLLVWALQAIVFWRGMESIKRFIDWAGPAVYAVMIALALWIVEVAGIGNISFDLSSTHLHGGAAFWQMIVAVALVAGYFAGPTLNFADFARYCRSYKDVKRGNLLGLPINFLFFSIITVVVVSGTIPVFGKMITDPVITVGKIGNTAAALLGAFTFVTATIGINIVANFVSPAFDFSNVWPSRISFRMGGMIAAFGSVFITPWNLFSNPAAIHYTVNLLAAAIGPLYGILLSDYYLVRNQRVDVPALFSDRPGNTYWYKGGVNPLAVMAVVPATLIAIALNFLPGEWATFSLFIGGGLAAVIYTTLSKMRAAA
jgi:NCS1 family nucleobase:cation symporter-1